MQYVIQGDPVNIDELDATLYRLASTHQCRACDAPATILIEYRGHGMETCRDHLSHYLSGMAKSDDKDFKQATKGCQCPSCRGGSA